MPVERCQIHSDPHFDISTMSWTNFGCQVMQICTATASRQTFNKISTGYQHVEENIEYSYSIS